MSSNEIFLPEFGIMQCNNFSNYYPLLNQWLMENGNTLMSRNGEVYEILNFKTVLNNPYKRCIGADKRNINIFFLLAEAMWIFTGRKDVEFLNIFNSNMVNFSDDGKVFHAPYGFRIRHWGVRSEEKFTSENLHAAQGFDQLSDIIKMLVKDESTRQAVISIWNPELDLGVESKDIPCNDLLMLKIRDKKLHITIQNRSNDLHWGLTTNIFQFSFLAESISNCLGIELGTQTHNSQSLHIYKWNETTISMLNNFKTSNIYEHAKELKMDFNFSHDLPSNRLRELDYYYNNIITNIIDIHNGKSENKQFVNELYSFSKYFTIVYNLLKIYVEYKNKKISKQEAFDLIEFEEEIDILALAKNFFAVRLGIVDEMNFIGNL